MAPRVPGQAPQTAVAAWRSAPLVSGDRAADIVFAPLEEGEAPRIGILGDSGTGKTEAARALVAEYLRRVPGVAYVIDDKGATPRFAGQYRRDVAELAARPPDAEPRVVVFRGAPSQGVKVDPERVSRAAWALAVEKRRPVLVVYDELARAADEGEWRPGVEQIPRDFAEGRDVRRTSIWGSQSPQDVPRVPFEQSSAILQFRIDGMGLNLLRRRNYVFEDRLVDVIRSLPGDDVPKPQRGYFVLLRRGRPWDGNVYRFAPAA